ncbi:hypothetical protein [Epilithonimonas sp.]|jgi:hypothetical protein|uniref:hypothetical protein n=1 Tax=Epilithonimonas sp. TaxID=2894511 RepID=UPI0035AFA43C
MKKSILILTAIVSQLSFGQVSLEKNNLVKDGQKYKLSKYNQVLTNPQAIDYFKKGRTNKTFADIFAFSGGFGVGFGLVGALISPKEKTFTMPYGGTSTIKNDSSGYWTVFGVGAGLAVISIPFYVSAKKNFDKAIKTENGETVAFKPYFRIESAGNGLAMSYNF